MRAMVAEFTASTRPNDGYDPLLGIAQAVIESTTGTDTHTHPAGRALVVANSWRTIVSDRIAEQL